MVGIVSSVLRDDNLACNQAISAEALASFICWEWYFPMFLILSSFLLTSELKETGFDGLVS